MSTKGKFWFVWNPSNRAPHKKHATLQSARDEATRLARTNPGQTFVVLESVGEMRTVDVEWAEHSPTTYVSFNSSHFKGAVIGGSF